MAANRTYNWQQQQQVAVKGTGSHTSVPVGVPTWSRPASNGGNEIPEHFLIGKNGNKIPLKAPDAYGSARGPSCKLTGRRSGFNPRPLKVWRKQLHPVRASGGGRSGIGNPMDRPEGSSIRASLAGLTPEELKAKINDPCCAAELSQAFDPLKPQWGLPEQKDKGHSGSCGPTCTACNPEAHVTRRATTVLSKQYYTDSRAYLRARGRRYDQNLGGGSRVPWRNYMDANGKVLYNNGDPAVRVWQYGGRSCPPGTTCKNNKPVDAWSKPCQIEDVGPGSEIWDKKWHVYKPSNREFATQGAVESSTRLERLKLNTINRAAKSAQVFGSAARNASRYSGRPEAPVTVKSAWSLGVCRRVSQNKAKCCRMVSNKLGTAPASRIPHASAGQSAWCANSGKTILEKNKELVGDIINDPDSQINVRKSQFNPVQGLYLNYQNQMFARVPFTTPIQGAYNQTTIASDLEGKVLRAMWYENGYYFTLDSWDPEYKNYLQAIGLTVGKGPWAQDASYNWTTATKNIILSSGATFGYPATTGSPELTGDAFTLTNDGKLFIWRQENGPPDTSGETISELSDRWVILLPFFKNFTTANRRVAYQIKQTESALFIAYTVRPIVYDIDSYAFIAIRLQLKDEGVYGREGSFHISYHDMTVPNQTLGILYGINRDTASVTDIQSIPDVAPLPTN